MLSDIIKNRYLSSSVGSAVAVVVVVVVVAVVVVVVVVVVGFSFSGNKASLAQHNFGNLKPPTFSNPHTKELIINLGNVLGMGLLKFDNNCRNGEHLLYNSHDAS